MIFKRTNTPAIVDDIDGVCYHKSNFADFIREKYHVSKGENVVIKQGAVLRERSAVAELFDAAKAELERLAECQKIDKDTFHTEVNIIANDLFVRLLRILHDNICDAYTRTYLATREQFGIRYAAPTIPSADELCPWLSNWLEKTKVRLLNDIADVFAKDEWSAEIQKTTKSAGILGILALLLLLLSGCSDKSEKADEDAQHAANVEAIKDALSDSGAEYYQIVCNVDEKTCETCAAMAGKTFLIADFASGETAPPFHPNCRCLIEVYATDLVGEEDIPEEHLQYIPNVFRWDGASNAETYFRNASRNWTLQWNQEKINAVWDTCRSIYDVYGVQLDPRLLLAIIIAEGTGSFNTNTNNLAADGMPGVQTNLSIDLVLATNLLLGKLLGYAYYGKQYIDYFNEQRAQGITFGGDQSSADLFNFLNWNTPIVDIRNETIRFGVYATDQNWINNVWAIYRKLIDGTNDDVAAYSDYVLSIDHSIITLIVGGELLEVDFYIDDTISTDHNGKKDNQNIIGTRRM